MKIEATQITAFLLPEGTRPSAMEVFAKVFPSIPVETFNRNPNGQSQATAAVKGHQVAILSLPDRIDLHVAAAPANAPGDGEIDTAFLLNECLRGFSDYAASVSPARLAVVVNAAVNANTPEESVKIFRSRAKEVPLPGGTDEVELKVNVPRQSKSVAGISINVIQRLYSVVAITMMVGSNGELVQRGTQPQLNEQLDVNTVAGQTISPEKVAVLFNELADIALGQIGKDYGDLEVGGA